tara:strand:- start:92 stop:355 length:264 start_codon:yes stop_codon:yes gene_type:complete
MYAMLSLDLDRLTTSDQRKIFYEHLKNEKWVKISKVTTTWRASFEASVTEAGAIQTTKNDVAMAAKKAGVTSYDAIVHIGANEPAAF